MDEGRRLIELRIQQLSHRKETYLWAVVLLVVALLASWPLFSANHIIHGFDIVVHLGRIEGLKDALLSGQFPVRVNPFQLGGYGMPTDIFYPDVFRYFPAILRLIDVPLLASWKAYLIMLNILTVFCCWWAFAAYTRSLQTGAVAALFYEIFLFRFVMVYDASAAASPLGMAFLPGAIVSVWLTLRRDPHYWIAAAFFCTGIFLSHIVTGFFLLFAVVVMVLASLRRFQSPEVRWAAGKAVLWTFLLILWFYAPLLYFNHYMDYQVRHVTEQDAAYNYIYYLREMDFYMGSGMFLVLAGISGYMFLHRKRVHFQEFLFFLVSSAIVIFIVSRPWLWHILGHIGGILQFPSRLTVFPMFFLSLAIARGFEAIGLAKMRIRILAVLCVLFSLGGNFWWLSGHAYSLPPQERQNKKLIWERSLVSDYLNGLDFFSTGFADYIDVPTRDRILNAHPENPDRVAVMREKFKDREIHPSERLSRVQRNTNDFVLQYDAGREGWIQLPIFWYIGYTAEDPTNAKSYEVRKDEDGQVSVWLPPEAGTVHVWYGGLSWFHLTDLISWFSLFGFLYIAIMTKKRI
ncbi:MAG: hypothetical protein SPL82_09640 [Lachnospiraceae bacterium]|nr:hypothetical protein [Lachnospiraceae bacterium]